MPEESHCRFHLPLALKKYVLLINDAISCIANHWTSPADRELQRNWIQISPFANELETSNWVPSGPLEDLKGFHQEEIKNHSWEAVITSFKWLGIMQLKKTLCLMYSRYPHIDTYSLFQHDDMILDKILTLWIKRFWWGFYPFAFMKSCWSVKIGCCHKHFHRINDVSSWVGTDLR